MNVCPLCNVMYLGTSICPECATETHWTCCCGGEWQSASDWSRRPITVDYGSVIVIHRIDARCGPALLMREASA